MAIRELRFGVDDKSAENRKTQHRRAGTGAGAGDDDDDDDDMTQVTVKNEKDKMIYAPKASKGTKRKWNTDQSQTLAKVKGISAIDYGMTNSAISFASVVVAPQDVKAEKEYPGAGERRSKVPSVVAYADENPGHEDAFDNSESLFGFEVTAGTVRHAFAKLWVDEGASASKFDDDILQHAAGKILMQAPSGVPRRKVVVDSLRHLYKIHNEKLVERCGQVYVDDMDQKFVLTYPAGCSEQGKSNLLEAAEEAGYKSRPGDEIAMISEAEAAALAAFASSMKRLGVDAWSAAYKKRDCVTVVDIGGLTVDLATHLITAIEPFLKLQEKCIPNAIYSRVYEHLIQIFGHDFTKLPPEEIGHGSPLLMSLEKELRKFDGKILDKEVRLELAMREGFHHASYDESDGTVVLLGHQIKNIMDATIDKIILLIRDQIDQAKSKQNCKVKIVVLCGGGSLFPYIFNRIQHFCEKFRGGAIQMIRPDDPQSVVARGAVIAFLQRRIVGLRRCRACFGVKVHKKFTRGDWDARDLFQCPVNGPRVDGFTHWHLLQGDKINTANKKGGPTLNVYTTLAEEDLNDDELSFRVDIYTYKGEIPWPTRVSHPGVSKLGNFVVRPYMMSKAMKKRVRKALKVSREAKVALKVMQLVATETGQVEFAVKIGNIVVGCYRLSYDATREANE